MLASHIKEWLQEFEHEGYVSHIRESQGKTSQVLESLGFSKSSEIFDFYMNFGAMSSPGWYEILEVDDLQ